MGCEGRVFNVQNQTEASGKRGARPSAIASGTLLEATVIKDSATAEAALPTSSDPIALHAALSMLLVLAHNLRQQVRAGRARAASAVRDRRGRFLSRAAVRARWLRDKQGRFRRPR